MRKFILLRMLFGGAFVIGIGAELYAEYEVPSCNNGCHLVIFEYFSSGGFVTEYNPPKARNAFTTPSPDGGIYASTVDGYDIRQYSTGYPFCSPCGASCNTSAAGNSGPWVTI